MLCYWKLLLVSPIRWLSGGDFNTNDDWFKFNIRGGRNLYMEGYWNSFLYLFFQLTTIPVTEQLVAKVLALWEPPSNPQFSTLYSSFLTTILNTRNYQVVSLNLHLCSLAYNIFITPMNHRYIRYMMGQNLFLPYFGGITIHSAASWGTIRVPLGIPETKPLGVGRLDACDGKWPAGKMETALPQTHRIHVCYIW